MPSQQTGTTRSAAGTKNQDQSIRQFATAAKVIIAGVAIVGLGMVFMWSLDEMKVRNEYNRIVSELMDAGQHQQAITALKELQSSADEAIQVRINSDLAQCYLALSRRMEINLQQQKEFLNQAYALDPTALDPQERMVIGK